ncbi:rab11 family-interacting protein 1-like isoform X2 [Pomacea canaliculata]|uniref:rab11 family-interacting protein 1-like isoform X2 n=1 Tax=Pomacea canaliculata TaxID=400727 RepID=UPI000D73C60E|nr:rab11 family-interacting protein 1-like isoform X2 [Pomacea canaliculata]XP_025088298.1 rab11 family-interacting protein 1-like isoform X2 [Pomacea canaliculata]
MSAWNPSHVQFTVLRARNLISKGKSGSNDVFVTIQLGKEKYQTSTIKNAQNPEWFEECDLPIPHMHSEIEVQLFHRGILSDDFLGYTTIPLWEQKIQDKAKSQWIHLKNKPSRGPDNKPRGEIEVKVTFHSHSRVDFSSGLKKRSSSLRNLATAFGDRLKLTRSKSFRENRKDPEGGKPDKHLNQNHGSLNDIPERKPHMQKGIITSGQRKPPVTPLPTVSFPALDVNHSWVDAAEEGLTRSYSMSAAYVKTMSLDRGGILSLTSSADQPDISQSAFNVAGNRRSMVELPSSQLLHHIMYDLHHRMT